MEIRGRKEKMDCRECERLIPDFIGRKLDFPTLKRLYEHVGQCGDCREELDIRFLVTEGIQRLEDGNAFDFQSELEQRLEETRRNINFHSAFLYLGIVMELIAACLLGGVGIWILL